MLTLKLNLDTDQAALLLAALEAAYLEGTQREDRVCVMCADEGYEAGYADGVEASAKVCGYLAEIRALSRSCGHCQKAAEKEEKP